MYRIETVHKARLVHRDIKPGNFGIDETGRHIYIFGELLLLAFLNAFCQ